MKHHGLFFALIVLMSAGCTGWRAARQPEPIAPDTYVRLVSSPGVFGDSLWWPALGDTALDAVMAEAFAQNLTLRQAVARLDQYRALYVVARSALLPTVSAAGTYSRSGDVGSSEEAAPSPMITSSPTTQYSAALSASYELDIWGRLTAGRAAAMADLHATEENLHALAATLAAQVARTYYQVAEQREQIDLLDRTISSYTDSHALVEARYQRGVARSLDVYQAETNLAGARARRAAAVAGLAAKEHALSVLLGRYPGSATDVKARLPEELPDIQPGLPSELVTRRPDVKAAYWAMMAADRRSAEAAANRLPRFSLTGSVSGSSDELKDALDPDGMIWNAIANLLVPIFEGGRRRAQADAAEAGWEMAAAAYRQALLNAFREVEDGLILRQQQREYLRELEAQVRSAEASLRLATEQYLRGVSDYLPVVVAQATYFNAQSSRIAARRGLLDAHIGLVTALGGGWAAEVVEPPEGSN